MEKRQVTRDSAHEEPSNESQETAKRKKEMSEETVLKRKRVTWADQAETTQVKFINVVHVLTLLQQPVKGARCTEFHEQDYGDPGGKVDILPTAGSSLVQPVKEVELDKFHERDFGDPGERDSHLTVVRRRRESGIRKTGVG